MCVKLDICPSVWCFYVRRWALFTLSLWAGSWIDETAYIIPLVMVYQITIFLWVFRHETHWFWNLYVLGDLSPKCMLKVVMPNVVFEYFTPWEALGFKFPLSYGNLYWERVFGKTMSQPLLLTLMWFSSHLPNLYSSQSQSSLFFFFLRGNYSVCSHRLSIGPCELRAFLPYSLVKIFLH